MEFPPGGEAASVRWWSLDSPPVIVIALTIAAGLLMIEVALPTFGVAGIGGFAMLWVGIQGVAEGGHDWAALTLIAVGVALWAVLLVRRTPSVTGQAAAAGFYALGTVGFGLMADSPGAVAVGVAATGGLAATFPLLLRATNRLLNRPPQVGMEAFEGRRATVVSWDWEANRGTVRLDGSLWTATATVPVRSGDEVVVVGHDRMELRIIPAPVAPR
jgi:membrane-bound ClpP family serine protease